MLFIVLFATCKEFYTGETGKLNARVRVHKQQIKDSIVRYTPCCEHFAKSARENLNYSTFYSYVRGWS